MTAPLYPRSPEAKLGHLAARVSRLERRPIPEAVQASYARLSRTTSVSVAAGATYVVAWEDYRTTNQVLFDTAAAGTTVPNNTSGDTRLLVQEEGLTLTWAATLWETGTYAKKGRIDSSISVLDGGESPEQAHIIDNWTKDMVFGAYDFYTTPGYVQLYAINGSGVARNLLQAQMVTAFWPMTEAFPTVVY